MYSTGNFLRHSVIRKICSMDKYDNDLNIKDVELYLMEFEKKTTAYHNPLSTDSKPDTRKKKVNHNKPRIKKNRKKR